MKSSSGSIVKRRNQEFVVQDQVTKKAKEIPFDFEDKSRTFIGLPFLPRDVVIFIFSLLDWFSILSMRQTCHFARAACSFDMIDRACLKALTKWPKICEGTTSFVLSAPTCHSRESEETRCSCQNKDNLVGRRDRRLDELLEAIHDADAHQHPVRRAQVLLGGGNVPVQYVGRIEPRKRYCGHHWLVPNSKLGIGVLFGFYTEDRVEGYTFVESNFELCPCAHPDDSPVFRGQNHSRPSSYSFSKAVIYYENNVKTWQEIVIVTLKYVDVDENKPLHDRVHMCFAIGGWELAYAYASKHRLSGDFVRRVGPYEEYLQYINELQKDKNMHG